MTSAARVRVALTLKTRGRYAVAVIWIVAMAMVATFAEWPGLALGLPTLLLGGIYACGRAPKRSAPLLKERSFISDDAGA